MRLGHKVRPPVGNKNGRLVLRGCVLSNVLELLLEI